MMSIGKFVTDPEKKARLKEKDGIGTEATRANIIKTIKDRSYVETKGKTLRATPKGIAFIAALDADLPALADPGETAVWDAGLEAIAQGKTSPEKFVGEIGGRIRDYLAILGRKPDAPQTSGPEGKPTGLRVREAELLDHGDFYSARGAFAGRIYKDVWGHKLTPDEIIRLIVGGETVEVLDCKKRDGSDAGPKKLRYNAHAKPYPGVEVINETGPAVETAAASPRKGGGAIQDHGEFFTAPGYESGGRPVRFYKKLANRPITAEELAAILASKDAGVRMSGFKKADGTSFKNDPLVKYNGRKKPYAGLDFDFA